MPLAAPSVTMILVTSRSWTRRDVARALRLLVGVGWAGMSLLLGTGRAEATDAPPALAVSQARGAVPLTITVGNGDATGRCTSAQGGVVDARVSGPVAVGTASNGSQSTQVTVSPGAGDWTAMLSLPPDSTAGTYVVSASCTSPPGATPRSYADATIVVTTTVAVDPATGSPGEVLSISNAELSGRCFDHGLVVATLADSSGSTVATADTRLVGSSSAPNSSGFNVEDWTVQLGVPDDMAMGRYVLTATCQNSGSGGFIYRSEPVSVTIAPESIDRSSAATDKTTTAGSLIEDTSTTASTTTISTATIGAARGSERALQPVTHPSTKSPLWIVLALVVFAGVGGAAVVVRRRAHR